MTTCRAPYCFEEGCTPTTPCPRAPVVTGERRQAELTRAAVAESFRSRPARLLLAALTLAALSAAALPVTGYLAHKDRELALAARV